MSKRSGLILLLVLVVLPSSLIAQSSTNNAAAAPPPAGAGVSNSADEERFKLLESKIEQLETQNAELSRSHEKSVGQRLDDMSKEMELNYPSAYEKTALNLTIILTDVTIAATLAGLAYAFVTLARTRTTYRADARKEAAEMVTANNHFLTGRFSHNIALVLSEIAWEPDGNYTLNNTRLATVAVDYQKASYSAFREKSRPELEEELPPWTLKSVNNLVFMLSNFASHSEGAQIHVYLDELRNRPEFQKEPILVNTYCHALLVFRDSLAARWNCSVQDVIAQVGELLTVQDGKRDEMKPPSIRELDRVIDQYNHLVEPAVAGANEAPQNDDPNSGNPEPTQETTSTTPTTPA